MDMCDAGDHQPLGTCILLVGSRLQWHVRVAKPTRAHRVQRTQSTRSYASYCSPQGERTIIPAVTRRTSVSKLLGNYHTVHSCLASITSLTLRSPRDKKKVCVDAIAPHLPRRGRAGSFATPGVRGPTASCQHSMSFRWLDLHTFVSFARLLNKPQGGTACKGRG
jgi:hypothetical protein